MHVCTPLSICSSVSVYVCVIMYTFVCACECAHSSTHMCTCGCMHVVSVFTYVHAQVCMHAHLSVYTFCMCVHVCAHSVSVCMCVHGDLVPLTPYHPLSKCLGEDTRTDPVRCTGKGLTSHPGFEAGIWGQRSGTSLCHSAAWVPPGPGCSPALPSLGSPKKDFPCKG